MSSGTYGSRQGRHKNNINLSTFSVKISIYFLKIRFKSKNVHLIPKISISFQKSQFNFKNFDFILNIPI